MGAFEFFFFSRENKETPVNDSMNEKPNGSSWNSEQRTVKQWSQAYCTGVLGASNTIGRIKVKNQWKQYLQNGDFHQMQTDL